MGGSTNKEKAFLFPMSNAAAPWLGYRHGADAIHAHRSGTNAQRHDTGDEITARANQQRDRDDGHARGGDFNDSLAAPSGRRRASPRRKDAKKMVRAIKTFGGKYFSRPTSKKGETIAIGNKNGCTSSPPMSGRKRLNPEANNRAQVRNSTIPLNVTLFSTALESTSCAAATAFAGRPAAGRGCTDRERARQCANSNLKTPRPILGAASTAAGQLHDHGPIRGDFARPARAPPEA